MRKGCLYWLFIGWWWEPFIWIFKLFFNKTFFKIFSYMVLFAIVLYVAVAAIPFAIICFAIYALYIFIRKILDGSLKKKYNKIILCFKNLSKKFKKADDLYSGGITYREPEKLIVEEKLEQINTLSEEELAYIQKTFSDNITQIKEKDSNEKLSTEEYQNEIEPLSEEELTYIKKTYSCNIGQIENEEKQKIEKDYEPTKYRKPINPVYVHREESSDWERYAVMCNAHVIREERKEKEREQLESDLDKINSNLNNVEMQIEEMMASAITTPNSFDNMDGHQFEYFCADILRKNGFLNVSVTQGSGDHGIDILAEKDDITYAIQCKCYSCDIGNSAVQQAHTGKSIYHKDIAVVLTNRYFTTQAIQEANILGVKLWDRDKLNEMINNQL